MNYQPSNEPMEHHQRGRGMGDQESVLRWVNRTGGSGNVREEMEQGLCYTSHPVPSGE
jgi:hypothetical protein